MTEIPSLHANIQYLYIYTHFFIVSLCQNMGVRNVILHYFLVFPFSNDFLPARE